MTRQDKTLSWERILGQVKAFHTTEGRMPHIKAVSSREAGLALWFRDQQKAIKTGLVSAYRGKLLKDSGLLVNSHAAEPSSSPGYTALPSSYGKAHPSLQCLVDKQQRLVLQAKALSESRQAKRAEANRKRLAEMPQPQTATPHPLVERLAAFDACFVDRAKPDAVARMARACRGPILWVTEGNQAAPHWATSVQRCPPDRLGQALGLEATGANSTQTLPRHVLLVDLGKQGMVNALGALSRLRGDKNGERLPSLAVLGGPQHRTLCRVLGVPEHQSAPMAVKSGMTLMPVRQAA